MIRMTTDLVGVETTYITPAETRTVVLVGAQKAIRSDPSNPLNPLLCCSDPSRTVARRPAPQPCFRQRRWTVAVASRHDTRSIGRYPPHMTRILIIEDNHDLAK